MQRVKLFKGIESELARLENDVNHWLTESGARIVSLTGNIAPQSAQVGAASNATMANPTYAPSDVLLIALYEAPPSQAPTP